jgi:hypothetical protein
VYRIVVSCQGFPIETGGTAMMAINAVLMGLGKYPDLVCGWDGPKLYATVHGLSDVSLALCHDFSDAIHASMGPFNGKIVIESVTEGDHIRPFQFEE